MVNVQNVIKSLKEEEKGLTLLIIRLEQSLSSAPEGTLRISRNRGTASYYLRTEEGDTNGTYIKKQEEKLAKALAQKDYDMKLLEKVKKRRNRIQGFLRLYEAEQLEDLYTNLSPERQSLVNPYCLPDDAFIKQWEQQTYEGKGFEENVPEILTEKGERVRSKSEKILADKFYMKGIPYHYELPLYLKGYGKIYPDFTLLNCRNRQVYYLEHLGLMDNAEYCEKAIRKITNYMRNGIFPGERLLLTYETSKMPLDMKIVGEMIVKYLL